MHLDKGKKTQLAQFSRLTNYFFADNDIKSVTKPYKFNREIY